MIARLAGRIVEKEPHQVIIDAGGVGYRLFIPLSTFYTLPAEEAEVVLRVHTHMREDSLSLFGFATREEQQLFERLIEISGIGPRLALSILSGLPSGDLMQAISEGDSGRLRGIPGVGPKTADRVVLELRDRVRLMKATIPADGGDRGRAAGGGLRGDVVSALVNLGYRQPQAEEAVRRALGGRGGTASAPPAAAAEDALQDLLKRSLRYLAS